MLKTNAVKRISAFSLALIMILGTLPINVFAEGLQGKESGSAIVDSNTIKEEPAKEEKDSMAKSEQHIISFNPNGGSGEMKPIEVADGKNYTLPKNEFKAPEGKKFKNWLIEDQEQKEGYTLVVTRDLEIKAQWEEVKENKKELDAKTKSAPKVKEDAGKESDKLELSDSLTSSAVMANNDSRYALFKSEPELLTNGEVDLASKDEKNQGKFNKITSLKLHETDQREDAHKKIVLLKVSGETNITSTLNFNLKTLVNEYSFDKSGVKESMSKEEIINYVKTNLKKTGQTYLWGSGITTPKSEIVDNNGNIIGKTKSGNVIIDKLPGNLKSVRYEVILNVTLDPLTNSTNGNIVNDVDVFVTRGKDSVKLGSSKVTPYNQHKYVDEIVVTEDKSDGTKRVVDIDNVSPNLLRDKDYGTLFKDGNNYILSQSPYSLSPYINLNYFVSLPGQFITKDNKISYELTLNTDAFRYENQKGSSAYFERAEEKGERVVAYSGYNSISITYPKIRLVTNESIFNTGLKTKTIKSGEDYYSDDKEIVENFTVNNGNLTFDYFNEGEDKANRRSILAVSGFIDKMESFKEFYNEGKIYLKDLSLINEDGSYDIPLYTVTAKRNGKVISEAKVNVKGKFRLNSGQAFSEFNKITYEKGIVEEREIPILEKRIADNTLLKGEEKVIQKGEVGKEKVTYDKQFVNGEFFGKVNEKTEVVKPMKPRIIHYGTAEKLVNKTTETVKYDTIYEADQTLKYEEKKTTQQGKNGSKEITTTTTLVSGKRKESKDEVVTVKPTSEIIKIGNKKVDEEKLPFKTIEEIDKTLKEGQTKIKVKGVEGLKTTTTIYEVDKKTGKLINPKETVTKKDPVNQIVLKGTKPDPIKSSIEAKVKYFGVGGAEEKPEAGKYKFVLKDNKGKIISEATNDTSGNVVFKELNITDKEIGSHKYTVEQVKGDDLTIEYDTHIENVNVNVSLSDDNKLSAKVTYDKDGAVFTNKLNTTSLQIVRLAEGEKPFVAEEVKNNKGLVVSHKISDNDKAKTIDGAEYDIYKINSDGTETKVTSIKTENGISNLVENLVHGKYKLKETKAPKGHFASKEDVVFEIEEKDAGNALVKFVSSTEGGTKITSMPSTGGQGTKALMIGGGVLLIAMAGVFALANKKKKELNK